MCSCKRWNPFIPVPHPQIPLKVPLLPSSSLLQLFCEVKAHLPTKERWGHASACEMWTRWHSMAVLSRTVFCSLRCQCQAKQARRRFLKEKTKYWVKHNCYVVLTYLTNFKGLSFCKKIFPSPFQSVPISIVYVDRRCTLMILILNVDWLISFLWSPFQSGSTQRSYRRVRVLSVCELSSKAQRAAIQPAVTDFTLGFMLSLVGKRMERKARKRVKLSWITTTFTNFVTGRTAVTFVRLKTKWQLLV